MISTRLNSSPIALILLASATLFVFTLPVHSQTVAVAEVSGTVSDETGAAIAANDQRVATT